jgi:hypothetical protein
MAKLKEIKEFMEKVTGLLAEHNLDEVLSMLHMTQEELRKKLYPYTPNSWYPASALVKLYRQYIPIQMISRKTGVSVGGIVQALKDETGYKTFAEHFADTKFKDLARQAAFCKDRNRLIALYYKRGWTLGDLAGEFGLPYDFLKQVLKEEGFSFEVYVPKRFYSPDTTTEDRNEKIFDEYLAGATLEELGEKYELTERRIGVIIESKQKKYFPLTGKKKKETHKVESKMKFRKRF